MKDWSQGLNPEQREAVLHETGPLLILAGAGSGKTTVLVSRTGHLLEKGVVHAKQMCVLTFTNKAAREVKHRVSVKLGDSRIGKESRELWTGTFHSFGLQILRQNAKLAGLPSAFGILDQSDATALLKELMGNIKNSAKDSFKAETLQAMMSQWRERGQTKAKNDDEYEVMLEIVLPKYLKRLEHLGVTDFDGLLLKPLRLFQDHPEVLESLQERFQQVMVDEFQDTNRTQFQLVLGLSQKHENLTVVGDDDQSIYGWRGACVSNILDFPKNYSDCKVIRLERNYRSTPSILKLANEVIHKNVDRHGKILRANPDAEPGPKPECFVYDTDDIEAEEVIRHIQYFKDQGFKQSDIAILYRSNGQGGLLESQLRQNRIEYAITGGTGFFDRKETRDVLAYLRCAILPNEVAFRRIINTPPRGIGETTIDRLSEFATANNINFVAAARRWHEAGVAVKVGESLDQLFALLANLPEDILGLPHRKLAAKAAKDDSQGVLAGFADYQDAVRTTIISRGEVLAPLTSLGSSVATSTTKGDFPTVAPGTPTANTPGANLIRRFQEIGYRDFIRAQCKDIESFNKRWSVLEIFGRVLESFIERGEKDRPTIQEFIDAMELRHADSEEEKEATPKVQLLTLHASKGLEFPVVILIGVEEDLLPHKTLGGDISEERRLFYVGVTRAKEHLVLSRARTRKRYGRYVPVAPSRFLVEVPDGSILIHDSGFRPVAADQREDMLAKFRETLGGKIAAQKIDIGSGVAGKAGPNSTLGPPKSK